MRKQISSHGRVQDDETVCRTKEGLEMERVEKYEKTNLFTWKSAG